MYTLGLLSVKAASPGRTEQGKFSPVASARSGQAPSRGVSRDRGPRRQEQAHYCEGTKSHPLVVSRPRGYEPWGHLTRIRNIVDYERDWAGVLRYVPGLHKNYSPG